jgi:two-component system chemotaxis response regulator CheB
VGVVLTGNLDDGTAGLLAIKRLGGIAVVQDPTEADYPGMPRSARENVDIDFVETLAGIGPRLAALATEPVSAAGEAASAGSGPNIPDRGGNGAGVAEELLGESGEDLGIPSGFTCPDCGGGLWESHDGELTRYRCRTGHAYSPDSLAAEQASGVDTALWTALRSLQESADLSRRLARRMTERGLPRVAARYLARCDDAERSAAVLRGVLLVPDISEPR